MANEVVGINAQGIAKIKQALEDYRKDVYTYNVISAANAKLTAAFKGTAVETQVKSLASTVMNEIDNYMKILTTDFNNRIDKVASAYKSQDSSSTAISNVTKSIKS